MGCRCLEFAVVDTYPVLLIVFLMETLLCSLSLNLAGLNPFQDILAEGQHQNLALNSKGGNVFVSLPPPASVKRKVSPEDNTSHLEVEKKDRVKEGRIPLMRNSA